MIATSPCETWSYVPPFTFRWSYYKENSDQPAFATRLRLNTITDDAKYGGKTPQNLISHTLHALLPVERYGKDHPEYFALVDGQRKLTMDGGGPEVCSSNPEVIDIVASNVIHGLEQMPSLRNVSVSQNDNSAYCQCPSCAAIDEREGTPMGSHLALVNAVAERVERRFPEVKIGTLAYWYTRKTPRTIRPRRNVQIQLCSIECSTLYPLDDPNCRKNREFCADMDAWGRVCDDLWIWNYNTNFRFYDLPFPNLRVIGPNLRYFLKNHVKGVFMQANGNGNGGELCDLRNYVLARCLWNPALDSWELAKEFCSLHYGAAGETMIAYLTYLHDHAERTGLEPTCFPMPFEVGLEPDSADRIFSLFQKALAEAENETVRNRVEKASISARRALIEVGGKMEVRDGRLRVVYPAKYGSLVSDYVALTKKHGQTRAEEWQPIEHFYGVLKKATEEGYRAEALENSVWRLVVVGEDNGKVVELRYLPSARDFLMPARYRSTRYLFDHLTLSELGEAGYRHTEPAAFEMERKPDGLRLTKRLKDGDKVEKWIGFDPTDPSAIRFRTVVTRGGAAPKTFRLRVHPEFFTERATTDANVLGAYVLDDGWVRFNDGWRGRDDPGRTHLVSAKGGGFAFFNHPDRFGLSLAYDPTVLTKRGFDWSETYPMASLDLTTRDVSLARGQDLTIEYSSVTSPNPLGASVHETGEPSRRLDAERERPELEADDPVLRSGHRRRGHLLG